MANSLSGELWQAYNNPSPFVPKGFFIRSPYAGTKNRDMVSNDTTKEWGLRAEGYVDYFGQKTLPERWFSSVRPALELEVEEIDSKLFVFPVRSHPVNLSDPLIGGLALSRTAEIEELDHPLIFASSRVPGRHLSAESPLLANPMDETAAWQAIVGRLFEAIEQVK